MQLPDFKLERYFAKYEFSAQYLLCGSDCEAMSIADLLALEPEGMANFQETWLGYTQSQGSPDLRNEICKLYKTIHPDQVLVHSGANEAIFLFMHTVLNPGDHVIVHSPGYQSLAEVAHSIGCEISLWSAHEEDDWALDIDQLPRLLQKNTKLIVINTPHNPTGFLMSPQDFRAVQNFAGEHGLLLFSDEVYRESEYDPAARLPAACDAGEHAISLGVTSKTYGLPGLRIGWIATKNKKVYDRMAALKDYTTICNSAPSEYLAEVAMRHHEVLAARNLAIIKNNLSIMDEFFKKHAGLFSWSRPRAGSMAFPRYLRGDVVSFCDELVHEAGVLLLPGSVYDDAHNHFRLGLGRRNLPEAVANLEAYLKKSSVKDVNQKPS
jgi:aspartate/methionine/tyrosine aminotransferase